MIRLTRMLVGYFLGAGAILLVVDFADDTGRRISLLIVVVAKKVHRWRDLIFEPSIVVNLRHSPVVAAKVLVSVLEELHLACVGKTNVVYAVVARVFKDLLSHLVLSLIRPGCR